jgi:hypothetical protein
VRVSCRRVKSQFLVKSLVVFGLHVTIVPKSILCSKSNTLNK